jgi:hypothetical protein
MRFKIALLTLILPFILAETIPAQDCYESSIISPYPFMGNDGEVFKMSDGSVWEVAQDRTNLFMYEYYPKVVICPSEGHLLVGGKMVIVEKMGLEEPTSPTQSQSKPSSSRVR